VVESGCLTISSRTILNAKSGLAGREEVELQSFRGGSTGKGWCSRGWLLGVVPVRGPAWAAAERASRGAGSRENGSKLAARLPRPCRPWSVLLGGADRALERPPASYYGSAPLRGYSSESRFRPAAQARRATERRWPVDPVWEAGQGVRISPTECGVIRRRIEEASELHLVRASADTRPRLLRCWVGADWRRRLSGSNQSWPGTWSRAGGRGGPRLLGSGHVRRPSAAGCQRYRSRRKQPCASGSSNLRTNRRSMVGISTGWRPRPEVSEGDRNHFLRVQPPVARGRLRGHAAGCAPPGRRGDPTRSPTPMAVPARVRMISDDLPAIQGQRIRPQPVRP
jgi:hypothetical protein